MKWKCGCNFHFLQIYWCRPTPEVWSKLISNCVELMRLCQTNWSLKIPTFNSHHSSVITKFPIVYELRNTFDISGWTSHNREKKIFALGVEEEVTEFIAICKWKKRRKNVYTSEYAPWIYYRTIDFAMWHGTCLRSMMFQLDRPVRRHWGRQSFAVVVGQQL